MALLNTASDGTDGDTLTGGPNAERGVAQSAAPLASSSRCPAQSASKRAGHAWAGDELLRHLGSPDADTIVTLNRTSTAYKIGDIGEHVESADSRSSSDNPEAMETQTRTPPSPLIFAHTTTVENMASSTLSGGVMDRVLSLDAYLAAHQPSPESSTSPTPQPATGPVPMPRAVGARSSEYTIKLNNMYQALAISQPRFDWESNPNGWCGKVVFENVLETEDAQESRDLVLEEKTPFGSKQEVKEKLSQKAVEELEKLKGEGRLRKKLDEKRVEAAAMRMAEKRQREPVINYIGMLIGTYTLFSVAYHHYSETLPDWEAG
jgi:hypothetical protein